MPDNRGRPAPEVALADDRVGDVAPRAAADQDLRARLPRALEQNDAQRRSEPAGEDGSGHPGRAGADDRDIAGRRKTQPVTKYYAACGLVETTVECAPQALQRMIIVFPSSRRPMIWVRWLPHFMHSCGG